MSVEVWVSPEFWRAEPGKERHRPPGPFLRPRPIQNPQQIPRPTSQDRCANDNKSAASADHSAGRRNSHARQSAALSRSDSIDDRTLANSTWNVAPPRSGATTDAGDGSSIVGLVMPPD